MLNSAPKTLGGSWAGTSGSITLVDENTAPYGKSFKATYSATGTNGGMYKTPKSKLTVGEKYSWSVWVKASKSITMTIGLEQGGTKTCSVTTSWQRFTHTFTAINNTNYAFVIYTSGTTVNSGDYYLVHSIMVEEATKPSSWNSAPEDINSDIITVDTKITTTNNKVAIIETNLSSITSRVSSTESSITTINGNVTSLQSRMTTAEQKITPTAITTTISSVITGGTGSISTTQFVMDKTGFTINNGALKVKNKAGTTVLEGDSNGNLILKNGCFKVLASNNSEIASIDQNNWMRVQGLHVFGLGQCMQNKGTGVRSLIIESTDGNAAHIDFNYGNSSLDYGVRLIREGSGSRMLKLLGSGLTVQNPSSNSNCDIELRSNGGPTYIDFSHDIHADYETRIITYQGDSKLHIVGGLVVDSGTKSAMQTTENYGNRLMYAVEACENYFEDIYNCQLVDGKCIVEMDKIFLECVNTKDYDYFLIIDELEECEGLFAPKELRSWDSFTVKEKHNGNSNIEFNVIVRAKRKDFENIRLEEMKSQPETNHLSKIN